MADEPEKSGQEPNLELPSLLPFGRSRRKRKGEVPQDETGTEPTAVEATPADAETVGADPLAADPVAPPSRSASGTLAPSADKAKRLPPVPPPTARTDAPAQQIPVPPPPFPPPDEPGEVEEPPVLAPPEVAAQPGPSMAEERVAVAEEPVAAVEEPAPVDEPLAEQTTLLAAHDPLPRGPEFVPAQAEVHHETPTGETPGVPVDPALGWPVEEPTDEQQPTRGSSLTLPAVDPRVAAVVTGAFVGLLGVVLAYFASRGCETVRGVGSCGGMGLLALLLIVAIEVVLGAILLKAWQLSDPTSTSFLGVGLVAVVVLLFLLSSLESVWMTLIIPVLSALAFLLSWWVTTAFVEVPGEDAHR